MCVSGGYVGICTYICPSPRHIDVIRRLVACLNYGLGHTTSWRFRIDAFSPVILFEPFRVVRQRDLALTLFIQCAFFAPCGHVS